MMHWYVFRRMTLAILLLVAALMMLPSCNGSDGFLITPNNWFAIAITDTRNCGRVGWTSVEGRSSKSRANADAVRSCQNNNPSTSCRVAGNGNNGCGALVSTSRCGWFLNPGSTASAAQRNALNECSRDGGANCRFEVVVCSG